MTVYAEGGTEDSPQQQEPSDRGNQATGARTNKHVPDEESKFVIDVENKSTEDFWGYEFRNLGGDGDWAFRCASVAYSLETGRPLTEATTATKSFIAILPCLSLSLSTPWLRYSKASQGSIAAEEFAEVSKPVARGSQGKGIKTFNPNPMPTSVKCC